MLKLKGILGILTLALIAFPFAYAEQVEQAETKESVRLEVIDSQEAAKTYMDSESEIAIKDLAAEQEAGIPGILNLAQTYELANKNDPQWAATKNSYQANLQIVNQSRSALLPNLSLTGYSNYQNQDIQGTLSQDYNTHGYGASLSQALFRMDTWFSYQAAKEGNSQIDFGFKADTQDFYIRVAEGYFDVLKAKAMMIYRESEQAAINRQVKQTQQRFDVGLVPITDVQEAEAAYYAVVVERINAQKNLQIAVNALETLTETPIKDVIPLKQEFPITSPVPNDQQEWVNRALEKNYELIAAGYAEKAAQNNYRVQKYANVPTVDIVASYNHTVSNAQGVTGATTGAKTPATNTSIIGVQLAMPLYLGGNIIATRKQAMHQYYEAQDNKNFAEQEVILDTSNLFLSVNTAVAQVQAQLQAITSAQVSLDSIQAGYNAGTRIILDVLDAEQKLYNVKAEYAIARIDYVMSALQLKQVAGTLTADDLLKVNAWLAH